MKSLKNMVIKGAMVASIAVSSTAMAGKPEKTTVADVASNAGTFNILLTAVGLYDGIGEFLEGRGQRTVFAPDDGAFADLAAVLPALCFNVDADPVNNLVAYVLDNPDYIREVLLYHVSKGRKDAAEVLPADRINTLLGDFITRTPDTLILDNPYFTDATIIAPNQFADNGVVHVIDQVLLPSAPPSYCP